MLSPESRQRALPAEPRVWGPRSSLTRPARPLHGQARLGFAQGTWTARGGAGSVCAGSEGEGLGRGARRDAAGGVALGLPGRDRAVATRRGGRGGARQPWHRPAPRARQGRGRRGRAGRSARQADGGHRGGGGGGGGGGRVGGSSSSSVATTSSPLDTHTRGLASQPATPRVQDATSACRGAGLSWLGGVGHLVNTVPLRTGDTSARVGWRTRNHCPQAPSPAQPWPDSGLGVVVVVWWRSAQMPAGPGRGGTS